MKNNVRFCSLISGSSGNCSFFSDGKTNILIDCGLSGKNLEAALMSIDVRPQDIDALLITHEHNDHIKGAGVVSRRYNIPIYATNGTHSGANIGAVSDENRQIITPHTDFEVGTVGVRAFNIPHDSMEPVGFCFFSGNEKYSSATDMGYLTNKVFDEIKGSRSVLLESNHDIEMLKMGPYPFPLKQRILSNLGHLSNETAAQTALALVRSGTKNIMLGHLSENNNRPEIAQLETYNHLTQAGVRVGEDVVLCVAHRYKATFFE